MNAAWIAADWPAPGGIIAGCTTRQGGVSTGPYESLNLGDHVGDLPDNVQRNRQAFMTACNLPAAPAWLAQVHGDRVARDPLPGETADAACSRELHAVCAVMVADCLPVLFSNRDGSEVAAAHAGWRGLAAGILENTVASFASTPADLMAWLGPAISQPAFEVGDEVRNAFTDADAGAAACFAANTRGRWQADIYELARRRLQALGVTQITGGELCTFSDADRFFSYRRDGPCGRMVAFVYRRK